MAIAWSFSELGEKTAEVKNNVLIEFSPKTTAKERERDQLCLVRFDPCKAAEKLCSVYTQQKQGEKLFFRVDFSLSHFAIVSVSVWEISPLY